ncbi:hypothetical protein HOY80DRAFT_985617 [Tuber brumale]|nr:hypothetical protein HOY80DRAFT_985617 [Tuber brumale]
MPFNDGYYQPTEGASLPTGRDCPTPAGSSPTFPNTSDPSPIFADTVLSENVRKRFLFAKNQRQRPIPVPGAESSGLSGHSRSTAGIAKGGDFVSFGAGAMVKENKGLEDTYEQFGNPVQGKNSGQFQNMNLSYNAPSGFSSKYTAPTPSATSPISPTFEPHRSGGHGVAIGDPASSARNRQTSRSHLSMGQGCSEGSEFLTEQLIPLHSFSPEKLVPRYPMDSSTSSPQERLPSNELVRLPVSYMGGISRGVAGASQELHSVERAGNMTTFNSPKPSIEEFIARQTAKARPRPRHWQTQCNQAMKFPGPGGCHFGRRCRYGHDGDVYEDNLSVYYTFEYGKPCPNFVLPATPGQPLGAQIPCSPWVVADINPQSQVFHAGQSNQEPGNGKVSHPHHHPPEHSYPNAPVPPPTSHRPHAPQDEMSGRDRLAITAGPSVTEGESLFRLEPLVRAVDYFNYLDELQSQTIGDTIVAIGPSDVINGMKSPAMLRSINAEMSPSE